jgi:hypothetical protein
LDFWIFSIFDIEIQKLFLMKKLAIILVFAFVLATVFLSCKSQDCPAYEDDVTASTTVSTT